MNTAFQRTTSSEEWYTPKEIIQALGEFDLDPCAPSTDFYTARTCFTRQMDGLSLPWHGRVWLNPPYTRHLITSFINRMAEHGNGLALIFNRMDIALWHDTIFPTASSLLILRGRIRFFRPDGSQADAAGCGSVLIAWGNHNTSALINSRINGKLINLK